MHDSNRRRNPTTERSMDTNLSNPRPLLLEIGVQVLVATSGLDSEKEVEKSRKTVSGPFELGDVKRGIGRIKRARGGGLGSDGMRGVLTCRGS